MTGCKMGPSQGRMLLVFYYRISTLDLTLFLEKANRSR